MADSCSLLIHKIFKNQPSKLINKHPKSKQGLIKKQIETTLKEIQANPCYGKTMRDVTSPRLIGKIRRAYIGGREDYRLIYIYPHGKPYVVPVFISLERKPRFNYNKVPWEQIANKIFEDYTNKNYSAFINW